MGMKNWIAFCIIMAALDFGLSTREVLLHLGQSSNFANTIAFSIAAGTLFFFSAIGNLMRVVKKEP